MGSVILCLQVHQPFRLRRYSVFDADPFYFDEARNAAICRRVADRCYRPATRLLIELAKRYRGDFRVAFSITGTAMAQWRQHCPDVIRLFQDLAATGCCEFLGETSHHSLASVYSMPPTGMEFDEQVMMHRELMREVFHITPRVFRNTELIYNDALAHHVASMRDETGETMWNGVLCEGVDRILQGRSPGHVYAPPGRPIRTDGRQFGILLRNSRLSDDIAFRFANRTWDEWPLTSEKFAGWIGNSDAPLTSIFLDYETFGEHQRAETGIFDFLGTLPEHVLRTDNHAGHPHRFLTPTMALDEHAPSPGARGEFSSPDWISWADESRDLSAWCGNAMQRSALDECFALERDLQEIVSRSSDQVDSDFRERARILLEDWRRLTTSDHAYYMSTKSDADGEVHKHFSPYEGPYDAYINYMNALDHLRQRVAELRRTGRSTVEAR